MLSTLIHRWVAIHFFLVAFLMLACRAAGSGPILNPESKKIDSKDRQDFSKLPRVYFAFQKQNQKYPLLLLELAAGKPYRAHSGDPQMSVPYQAEAIALFDQGEKLRWRTELPTSKKYHVETLRSGLLSSWDPSKRLQIGRGTPAVFQEKYVILEHGGLLAFKLDNGKIIFNYTDTDRTKRDFFHFDSGGYTITTKAGTKCRGSAPGALFLAACENKIVYFNHRTLVTFDRNSLKLRKELKFNNSMTTGHRKFPECGAVMTLDDLEVKLEGIIFLR